MEIDKIGNAVEVKNIDLMDDQQALDLGKVCAEECVVVVKQKIDEKRLFDVMTLWGDPSRAILHKYVAEKRLSGRHWRELLLNLGYISPTSKGFKEGMSRVSYEKNEKGKPTGIFTNGELDWHSDQQSHHDKQRVIGLMSLWGSKGSQTTFLCTAPAYDSLNQEDKTMVDELYSVWEWDGGDMCKELIQSQKDIVRYHMVPFAGMECPLMDQTATGRKGIKFPSHSFSHFRGMSKKDSLKFKSHLWNKINKPEYIHTQDWEDGEIVFMDQNITLHARPTNVKDGDKRTMSRTITYMNKLFPDSAPNNYVLYDGKKVEHEEFAKLVDDARKNEFYS